MTGDSRLSRNNEGYDQKALEAASREVHLMFLREGSHWGIKACEEMGRVFMTAYLNALPSETKDRQALIDAARYRFLRDNPNFQIEFTGDLTLDEHVDRGRGMFDDSRNNGGG